MMNIVRYKKAMKLDVRTRYVKAIVTVLPDFYDVTKTDPPAQAMRGVQEE